MALGWKKDYLRYRELFLKLLVTYRKRQDLKMFMELLLSLITVSFFSIFALKPTFLTITQLLSDNKQKEETLYQLSEKINNIVIAQNLYEQNLDKINIISQSIPNGPVPESLLRQIEGVANLNSMSILGSSVEEVILVGKEEKKQKSKNEKTFPGEVKGITFSVSTTGDFSSLYSFLQNINNLRRPVVLDSINLSSTNTDLGKVIVMLITGRSPYLGDEN